MANWTSGDDDDSVGDGLFTKIELKVAELFRVYKAGQLTEQQTNEVLAVAKDLGITGG